MYKRDPFLSHMFAFLDLFQVPQPHPAMVAYPETGNIQRPLAGRDLSGLSAFAGYSEEGMKSTLVA